MAIPRSMARSSSICVVQAEDRPLLRDRSSSTNSGPVGTMGVAPLLALYKALCEADGSCSYVRHDRAYKEIQPHWRKAFIGSMVLNTTRCPVVAWLDSDAVLGGPPSDLLTLLRPPRAKGDGGSAGNIEQAEDRRYRWPEGLQQLMPRTIKPGEIHMAVAGEGDVYNHNLSPFNAGVWVVANTRIGRALMAQWVRVYNETASKHWVRDPNGKHTGQDDLSWQCLQPDERNKGKTRPCDFSKEHYEQGAFVHHVLTHPKFKQHIRLVPWRVLQSPHPRTMAHHFVGPPRQKEKNIKEYWRYRSPPGGGGGGGGGGVEESSKAEGGGGDAAPAAEKAHGSSPGGSASYAAMNQGLVAWARGEKK